MQVIYDKETDTMDLIFREEPVKESDELREGIIIDYGDNGKVVSIEILEASKNITHLKAITYEIKEPLKV